MSCVGSDCGDSAAAAAVDVDLRRDARCSTLDLRAFILRVEDLEAIEKGRRGATFCVGRGATQAPRACCDAAGRETRDRSKCRAFGHLALDTEGLDSILLFQALDWS